MDTIESLLKEYAGKIQRVADQACVKRMLERLGGKLTDVAKDLKKHGGPIQLCPVPGCKKRAAPIFNMVCADHKGVAKTKIAKYREARRRKAAKS